MRSRDWNVAETRYSSSLKRLCLGPERPSLADVIEWNSIPVTESGCWLWLLSLRRFGHGQLVYRKKHQAAHRGAWVAFRGPIPEGMHVLHKCNVPLCVNPDHLYLGTDIENCADRIRAGTQTIPPTMRGSAHPMSRISEQVARDIKAADGKHAAIAGRFNVCLATVGHIKRGRQWKHI